MKTESAITATVKVFNNRHKNKNNLKKKKIPKILKHVPKKSFRLFIVLHFFLYLVIAKQNL